MSTQKVQLTQAVATSKALKILLVGDRAVGKSKWIDKAFGHPYHDGYTRSLGVVMYDMGKWNLSGYIWDCAGDTKGDDPVVNGMRYSNADCAIVMHDLSNPSSFDSVERWIKDIHAVCPGIPIVVVGNKNDLRSSVRSYPGYVNHCISVKNDSPEQLLATISTLCDRLN